MTSLRCRGRQASGAFHFPQSGRPRCSCALGLGGVPPPVRPPGVLRGAIACCGEGRLSSSGCATLTGAGGSPCLLPIKGGWGPSRGGGLPPFCGAPEVRRSSPPAMPSSGAGCRVLLPMRCGRGCAGTVPLAFMLCRGCVLQGWCLAVPGRWLATALRSVWYQAPSLFWAPISGGGQPGPVARVSQHQPHSVRSCKPALRAMDMAGGLPWGGCLAPLRGESEVRRSSSAGCPPPARAVGSRCPRFVGAGVRA